MFMAFRRTPRLFIFCAALICTGCSTTCSDPARRVAFDPFAPSWLLKKQERLIGSVAYRGTYLDEQTTTTTHEEYKEVVDLER